MKTVVAALIKKDDKYLIAKRSDSSKSNPGLWEFPGGKVEPGESEEEALKREIIEELNMMISVGKKLAETKIDDETVLKLYSCDCELDGLRLKDHSEVFLSDKLETFYDYDLAPADLELLEKIKPINKRPHLDELVVGNEYTNDDIVRIFCVSNRGGIRPSKRANCLVIIAKHDNSNPYDDRWRDGVLHYTGTGQGGNQTMEFGSNKKLAESNEDNVDLYLMESYEGNVYTYRGMVKLVDEPYYDAQKDAFGHERQVVKFPLKLIS